MVRGRLKELLSELTIELQQLQSNNCTATIAPDQLLCDNCDDDDDGDDYIWEG